MRGQNKRLIISLNSSYFSVYCVYQYGSSVSVY
jgi:hypothetical protein